MTGLRICKSIFQFRTYTLHVTHYQLTLNHVFPSHITFHQTVHLMVLLLLKSGSCHWHTILVYIQVMPSMHNTQMVSAFSPSHNQTRVENGIKKELRLTTLHIIMHLLFLAKKRNHSNFLHHLKLCCWLLCSPEPSSV